MNRITFTAECTEAQARMIQRVLAMSEELEHLALTAPDGTVFDACETAVIAQGRDLQAAFLAEAVAQRIESAEKKGRRSASAPAAGPRRTAVGKPGNSSAPSA
jgi:hypothetical protein